LAIEESKQYAANDRQYGKTIDNLAQCPAKLRKQHPFGLLRQ
jgi:hypothetical protein